MIKNIDGEKLVSYVETYLNKNINDVYDDDLLKIVTLPLYSATDECSLVYDIDYIVNMFSNVNKILLYNFEVNKELMNMINFLSLKEITFNKCKLVDNLIFNTNLESVIFINSEVEKFDFLNKLENLKKFEFFNPEFNEFDFNNIINNNLLEFLRIQCKKIKNGFLLDNKSNIIDLILVNTELDEGLLKVLPNLKSLERLFIDEKYKTYVANLDNVLVEYDLRLFTYEDE